MSHNFRYGLCPSQLQLNFQSKQHVTTMWSMYMPIEAPNFQKKKRRFGHKGACCSSGKRKRSPSDCHGGLYKSGRIRGQTFILS